MGKLREMLVSEKKAGSWVTPFSDHFSPFGGYSFAVFPLKKNVFSFMVCIRLEYLM